MMSLANNFGECLNSVLGADNYGTEARIKFYTVAHGTSFPYVFPKVFTSSVGNDYDDVVILQQSGSDVWVRGMQQPIDLKRGSDEAVLVEQGKLRNNDNKFYINGSIDFSDVVAVKIGLGSPVTQEFGLAEAGVNAWPTDVNPVYKKVYLRHLPTGSLDGE